jgi:hypothetical protein
VIVYSIGLPGRFAEWCDAAIAGVAGHLDGIVLARAWPSLAEMLGYEGTSSALDEAALALIETGASHLVMGARQPDERLRRALAETNARFVVALDDPRIAAADIFAETMGELSAVIRAVGNSCPLVMRCGSLPGALVIERQTASGEAAVSAIARHLDIELSTSDARTIVAELAAAGLTYSPNGSTNDWSSRIPAAGKPLVDGALAGYAELTAGGGIGQIVWTRDLFIAASDPSKRPTDILDVSDVSGDDRFLIYGPYIRVPPGLWTAKVILGVSEETLGHTFVVDAYAGKPLARVSFQSTGSGVYAPEISFSLDASPDSGLEIRILVGSNGAKGQLALGNVVLRHMSIPDPDDIPDLNRDFRAVLNL